MNGRSAALAFSVAVLLAACSPRQVEYHLRGETMGTFYNVKFPTTKGPGYADEVQSRIDELLKQVNARFSTYIDDSLICRFNANRSTEPFVCDAEFVRVLRESLRIARWTDGAYDPTILPLVRAYGFGPHSEHHEPGAEELAAARAAVDWKQVEIVDDTHVRKLAPDIELDLSSIAKGAGVDRVGDLLDQLGLPDHMVEIGGEVVCGGEKEPGVSWRIGIVKPGGGSGEPIQEEVELTDRALATSGDYRNFFESNGHRVHHVIDPRTGHSTDNGVVSVSVFAPTCTLADGLATALMVVGPDAAAGVLAHPEVHGVEVLYLLRGPDGGVVERRFP